MQVEQAAADVKVRETTLAKREADLSRQEAATLSGSADAIKREAEVAAREHALAAQLVDLKAAEAQLQEKKLEAKELQVSRQAAPCLRCLTAVVAYVLLCLCIQGRLYAIGQHADRLGAYCVKGHPRAVQCSSL